MSMNVLTLFVCLSLLFCISTAMPSCGETQVASGFDWNSWLSLNSKLPNGTYYNLEIPFFIFSPYVNTSIFNHSVSSLNIKGCTFNNLVLQTTDSMEGGRDFSPNYGNLYNGYNNAGCIVSDYSQIMDLLSEMKNAQIFFTDETNTCGCEIVETQNSGYVVGLNFTYVAGVMARGESDSVTLFGCSLTTLYRSTPLAVGEIFQQNLFKQSSGIKISVGIFYVLFCLAYLLL